MRSAVLMMFLLCTCTLVACGSSSKTGAQSPDGATTDGQVEHESDTSVPLSWSFSAKDDGSASPAVALKLERMEGDRALLQVVGRGLPTVQGIAFRLTFAPDAIEVEQSEAGPDWPSARTLSGFAARPEGELWAGIGFRGQGSLDASSSVTLARVKLKLRGSTDLGFRDLHNMVLDSQLQVVKVAWLGGRFQSEAR